MKPTLTTPESLHAARLQFLHDGARKCGLSFKLFAFFAGLEVQGLHDLHHAEHGETRGRPAKGEGKKSESFEAYLRRVTGLPYATAARYRGHWQSIVSDHSEVAKKLTTTWQKMTEGGAKLLTEGGAEGLSAGLAASALQTICDHADDWGLNRVFALADDERDVSEDSDEGGDSEGAKAKRDALVKFWALQVGRRLKADEFLHLPKASLETMATLFEDAAKKAKEALKAKSAKKGGRK